MKNPYFYGRPPGVYDDSMPLADRFVQVGGNTGNLLFISALHKVISHSVPSDRSTFDPRAVRERHDGIIIPAANWFSRYSDFGDLAQKIVETKLPCVIVGLGAQSHTTEAYPTPTAGTLRLIQVISERCHSLSVRGEYTADALAKYGVKNVTVTGCPSLLWKLRPLRVAKSDLPSLTAAIGTTRSDGFEKVFDPSPEFLCSVLLNRFALAEYIDYIAQTEIFDVQIAESSDDSADAASIYSDSSASKREFLSRVFDTAFTKVTDYARRRVKAFFNVESWFSYLSGIDIYCGTRLHGVLATLIAGKPAVLVAHDTRTTEMAKFLRIPALTAASVVDKMNRNCFSLSDIYDELDFSEFNDRQSFYLSNFIDYFRANDVSHLHLERE